MKPNFTLFLSSNGLRLLHRTDGDWQPVGTVDIDSADLEEELATLRRIATALEPTGVYTRLIMPNDQLRYLNIKAEGLDKGDARHAVVQTLEGVTPYPVSELVFDFVMDKTQCLIAAVARETLDEAEEFAKAHGFFPLCFAALPHDPVFAWQPSFGPTRCAEEAGLKVSFDEKPFIERPREISKSVAVTAAPRTAPAPSSAPLFRSRRESSATAGDTPPPFLPSAQRRATPVAARGFAAPETPFKGRDETSARTGAGTSVAERPTNKNLAKSEAERLTVFGARSEQDANPKTRINKPMVAAVLAFAVMGAGAWSAGINPFGALTSVLPGPRLSQEAPTAQFASPIQPVRPEKQLSANPAPVPPKILPMRATLTDEDSAVLDALGAPVLVEPDLTIPFAPDPARTQYAVTGIWVEPPKVPKSPEMIGLDDLYVTSIDPINPTRDAIALPDVRRQALDVSLPSPGSPAPAGTQFALDSRGLVAPSDVGTVNPDGVAVYSGPPPAQPPGARPPELSATTDPRFADLEKVRPRSRPNNLQETTERATFAGMTRAELAELRPKLRPTSDQERANASASLVPQNGSIGSAANVADLGGTAYATANSLRPDARPGNFAERVAATRASIAASAARAPAVRTASVAPLRVAPKIPSTASTKREATIENAINLRRINLIGVYGKPSDRRALVRMSNGRYKKVQVGDRIDGGRISAIGDAELRYQKSGRNMVLKMPRG